MLMVFDSNDFTTTSFVMWRIDARYSENSPIVLSELEVSVLVKNALVRRLKARGYQITVEKLTRGDAMNKTVFPVPALKNDKTETFCQQVAAEYLVSKDSAMKMYADYCNEKNLPYWATIAIKERISYLIREQSAVTQP
ncbi:hypothetical protein JQ760_027950 (plasmid) [Klebsiella pneumoniae]|uniref:hypothetical protein n=1 Tax=Klebsiella pneumoniae TaxID=573 RepID=UPI001FABC9B8|nr:hypothetical protein [Klebsiella pneumoniae]MCI8108507.1 hypothetical protein [Klebsiella pneumoniae]